MPFHSSNGDKTTLLSNIIRRVTAGHGPTFATESHLFKEIIGIINEDLELLDIVPAVSQVINKPGMEQQLGKSGVLLLHSLRKFDNSSLGLSGDTFYTPDQCDNNSFHHRRVGVKIAFVEDTLQIPLITKQLDTGVKLF